MIVFRQEGTTCVVVCPVEADNRYFPCDSFKKPDTGEEFFIFADGTPVFDTQGEAWAFHLGAIEGLKVKQKQQIDQKYDVSLQQIRKRAGRGLVLVQSDE